MTQLMRALGVDEMGGASYLGLMPHTTFGEIDQLVAALEQLTA
jgi:hypothetical protein